MHKFLQSCSQENSTKFIHSIFCHETEIHYKSSTNKFHAKQTAKLSDTSIHYVRNVIKKGKQEEEKKLLIEIVFSSQESGKARNTKRISNGTLKQAIHGVESKEKCRIKGSLGIGSECARNQIFL